MTTAEISRLLKRAKESIQAVGRERTGVRVVETREELREGERETLTRPEQPANAYTDGDSAADKVQKNVQRALAAQLQALSFQFREDQRTYLEGREQQERQAREGQLGSLGVPDTAESRRDDDLNRFASRGFNQQQLALVDNMELETDETAEGIEQIVQSINELAILFKELGELVVDQGTMLDRIDQDVEATVEITANAAKKLRSASRYQKKSRGKLFYLMIIVVVMFLVMLLIALAKYEQNKPSQEEQRRR